MKKAVALLISILVLSACSTSKIIKKDVETIKEDVNVFMVNWHKAAADANFDNYFNAMSKDAVYIGSAAEEIWTKKEFIGFSKPFFDRGKAWSFTTLERNVYVNQNKNFVWFDELLNTWMGTCRGSGVLENSNGKWQIKQYVLSVAIPNDDVQKVIKAKKENDAKFLEKYKN